MQIPVDATQFSALMPGSASLEEQAPESLDQIIIHAPPGTIERRYTFALAVKALKSGGSLITLAGKDKGGSRLSKELESLGFAVQEEARSHFRICEAKKDTPNLDTVKEMIAEGSPSFVEAMQLWSQPGVFSWNRLDPGSTLLLQHLPELSGFGADLGCGVGYLAKAVLQSKKIRKIAMYDIDRRAIEMAKKNMNLERVTLHWSDLRRENQLPNNLDFVITNPPFHDEGEEDKSLGQGFLKTAAKMLKRGGVCWVTANKHLPYEEVMRPIFEQVRVVTEKNGFKIFEAIK